MTHLVIDPVTRVGGGLRVEVEIERGAVSDAWVSGTVYRGLEGILEGRAAHDAPLVASRVCGSCSGIHALAAVRAVERAVGATIPADARLVRNLLTGSQFVLDHVTHFYARQAYDWVDLASAMTADEVKTAGLATALADWPNSTPAHFAAAKVRLASLLDAAGGGGLAAHGPWGHPEYRLPPEANLMIATHGLEALDWARELGRVRTILGGKDPHPQTFVVGGMSLAVPWGGPPPGPPEHPHVDRTAPTALSSEGLDRMADTLSHLRVFVEQAFVPDTIAIARTYPEWTTRGIASGTFLAGGEFPEDDAAEPLLYLPRGLVARETIAKGEPVLEEGISESSAHAWYEDAAASRHPADGLTAARYSGPSLPYETLSASERYSWIKAARYADEPAETGPLARMLIARVQGRHEVVDVIDRIVGSLGVGPEALFGTWGRIVARAIEATALAARLEGWLAELRSNISQGDLAVANLARWDASTWPSTATGWSLGESPAGAVAHWVGIRDARIDRYQIVDATTWNASPRSANGRRGPMEQALLGTPVADTARPIELLRTIHSFDPCPACGVH